MIFPVPVRTALGTATISCAQPLANKAKRTIKNNLNFEQSEELTQDVLSTIWSKAYLFNPEKSKFTTWSFTIARNKKIDFYRKTKKNDVNEDDIRNFLYPNDDGNDYEIETTINKIKAKNIL